MHFKFICQPFRRLSFCICSFKKGKVVLFYWSVKSNSSVNKSRVSKFLKLFLALRVQAFNCTQNIVTHYIFGSKLVQLFSVIFLKWIAQLLKFSHQFLYIGVKFLLGTVRLFMSMKFCVFISFPDSNILEFLHNPCNFWAAHLPTPELPFVFC